MHVDQGQVATDVAQGDRSLRLGRQGLELHQLGDAVDRDPRLLPRVEDLRQLLDRREEHRQVEDERDQDARRELALLDQVRTDAEHDDVGDRRQEEHEREVRRDQALSLQPLLEVAQPQGVEAVDGGDLVGEGLRLVDARQGLLEVGVDDGQRLAHRVVEAVRDPAEDDRRSDERDHHQQRPERQLDVEQQQRDPHADEGDERDQRGEQPVLDQRLELVDVGGHPGHDPAGHLPLVVVEREPLQLGPDPDPQARHDALAGAAGHEGLRDLVEEVDEDDHEERGRRPPQHLGGARRDAVVDARVHQPRAEQRGDGVEHDEQQPEGERPAELGDEPRIEKPGSGWVSLSRSSTM